MRNFHRLQIVLPIVVLLACGAVQSRAADDVVYSRDVHPILRQHCWSCHTGEKAEAGLRFDDAAKFRAGGDGGAAFTPGKPDASLLIEQVSGDPPAMPPETSPLATDEVAVLRRWIAGGAKIDAIPVDPTATVVIPQTYAFAPAITSVAISPDGRLAACACRSEAVLVALDGDAQPRRLATESDLVTHVEFSPDGKLLAAAGGTPALFGEVRFFDVASGRLVGSRRVGEDTLFRGNFAPDGKSIALGGADGAIYVVPVDAKEAVRRYELHSDWVVDVCFTPDGTKLVSAGRDKTTKVADAATGELLRTMDTLAERVNAVAADDNLAISAGFTKAVTGYDLAVALEKVEVSGAGNGAKPISRLAQYQKPFPAQSGEVLDLALSGDRSLLAVVGLFGEARLYTTADRKAGATVSLGAPSAYAVAISADGKRLVVGGKSGTLGVYQLPDGKLLRTVAPVPMAGTDGAVAERQ